MRLHAHIHTPQSFVFDEDVGGLGSGRLYSETEKPQWYMIEMANISMTSRKQLQACMNELSIEPGMNR
jgi:hypothetical protein